jgi:hypothetical protein
MCDMMVGLPCVTADGGVPFGQDSVRTGSHRSSSAAIPREGSASGHWERRMCPSRGGPH